MKEKLTWRDVLDCSKLWYGAIDKAEKAAKDTGYNYFSFNEIVYAIVSNGYYCTHISASEL